MATTIHVKAVGAYLVCCDKGRSKGETNKRCNLVFCSLEVLAALQTVDNVREHLFVLRVPATGPLGPDDADFSHVQESLVSRTGDVCEEVPAVGYFAYGKLGVLRGGLLYTPDTRKRLTRDDISTLQKDAANAAFESRRRGSRGPQTRTNN